MEKETTIKMKAGQKVFWLSSKGFTEGWIKRIQFNQDFCPKRKKVTTELKYFLTCDRYAEVYMGDEVKEELVFTSYKTMLYYYQKNPVK